MRRAGTGLQMRFVPTDLAPFARSIIARPDDSIWIRRTAESLPGFEVGAEIDTVVFDHFAADGTFVGEIRVACPAWMAEARVFVFDDTLVAIHAPDESDDEDPLRPVTIDVFTLRKAS